MKLIAIEAPNTKIAIRTGWRSRSNHGDGNTSFSAHQPANKMPIRVAGAPTLPNVATT